jgi:hypothetical protein
MKFRIFREQADALQIDPVILAGQLHGENTMQNNLTLLGLLLVMFV